MLIRKICGFAVLSLLILLTGAYEADACSCKQSRTPDGTFEPCGPYWNSETVFTGLAEKLAIDENGGMTVVFAVEKSIRGAGGEKIEIHTNEDTAGCGYPFKEGERYFVYARRAENGKLRVSLCSPTVLLKDAEKDLAYVKEIEAGKLGTRLFGQIYEDRQPTVKDKRTFEPLAGVEVTITGKKKKFRTVTDEKGFYLFRELPPDVYRVTAKFPEGVREIVAWGDVKEHLAGINKEGVRCRGEDFTVTRQGSISGRVVDFPVGEIKNPWNSEPQPRMSLFPLDENENFIPYRAVEERWAYRDKYEFYFPVVPAGKYLLLINPNNCPYPNNGIPTMFYPGADERSGAKIITVREGEQLVLEDFRSRPMLRERWISGAAFFADETPAAGVTVRLLDGNMNKCSNFFSETKTDEAGRFRIRGFESYEYKIDASAGGKNGQKQIYAKPSVVPGGGNVENIRVILDVTF